MFSVDVLNADLCWPCRLSPVVSQDPLWWTDPKFKKFKKKVLELDHKAEFHKTDHLKVRCGQCGSYVVCRVENNMERFREHRKSMKCKKSAGDQPSLNKFFPVASLTRTRVQSVTELEVACPGLCHRQDPRITQYLSRTVASCGGAPHRSILKIRVLKSQRRHRKLSLWELHSRIRSAERAQAAWSNDHSIGAVYSTKCTSQGVVGHNASLIMPCDECRKVLHLRIFLNALRRLPPKKNNWKFTPKEYRSELLGKAYLRHIDVQEFMEKVSDLGMSARAFLI